MAQCPDDVPWQRVINSQGKISERPGFGVVVQRKQIRGNGIRVGAAEQNERAAEAALHGFGEDRRNAARPSDRDHHRILAEQRFAGGRAGGRRGCAGIQRALNERLPERMREEVAGQAAGPEIEALRLRLRRWDVPLVLCQPGRKRGHRTRTESPRVRAVASRGMVWPRSTPVSGTLVRAV